MIEAPALRAGEQHDTGGVRVERVSRTFASRKGEVQALADVSLRAAPGEIVAVVGPSGCGKTTLLELICGLQAPDAGTVASAPAALMPQRDLLLPWLSAIDNAALALRARGMGRAEARAAAAPWLERFGLTGFEQARPAQLSGGMRQRVSFLRSLLAGKPVLALDEPFAALDAITRAEMQGWLAQVLATEPRTVVLVTHDVEEAVVLGDRVVVMSPRPGRRGPRGGGGAGATTAAHRRRGGGAARAGARGPGDAGMRRYTLRTALGLSRGSSWRGALVLVLILLGAWELYVDLGGADPLILPSPHAIAQSLFDDRGLLWSNFLVTAEEVVLGILVAAVAALVLASAMHFFLTLRRAAWPVLIASQTIPIPMLAPVLDPVAGVRHPAQAGGDRPGLVLLDRRHHPRRLRRRRPRFDQIDADLRHAPRAACSSASSSPRRCRACSPGPRSPSSWR